MYYDKKLLNDLYGATNITLMSEENSLILNALRHKLNYARSVDPIFNDNNYMFVLGIDVIDKLVPDLLVECKHGKLFGIKVCIDYNDKKSFKLFKEV